MYIASYDYKSLYKSNIVNFEDSENKFLSAKNESFSSLRQQLHNCGLFIIVVLNISMKSFLYWNYCPPL